MHEFDPRHFVFNRRTGLPYGYFKENGMDWKKLAVWGTLHIVGISTIGGLIIMGRIVWIAFTVATK
jgi:hypothetical protein